MSDTGHMTTTDYLMNIALIALVILQIRGHKVTRARLVFPLVATVFVAAQFLHAIPTAGNDLVLIVGFAAVGAALGAGAGLLTTVRRDGASAFAKAGPGGGRPVGASASAPAWASPCGWATAGRLPSPGSASSTTSPRGRPGVRRSS